MIENCLRHKIIRDFLKHYTENRWKDLIPSLIQIGILNLQKSFNKIFFTSEEIKKVLRHLQISQIEKDKEKNKEKERENKEMKDINKEIYMKLDKENNDNVDIINLSKEKEKENDKENKYLKYQYKLSEISKSNAIGENENNIVNIDNNFQKMKIIDIVAKTNQEKIKSCNDAINEMKNNIKNNYHYFKNNISIDFKNKLTRQKYDHYKKINIEQKNKNIKKQIDKVSYAISYDKDLRPESISKKINKNSNTNNIIPRTEYDVYSSNMDYLSEKKIKSKNNSKSTHKKGIKEKYLNLNLNNLNRINNMQNVKRKYYNIGKLSTKNEVAQTDGIEKNKYYKKINKNKNYNLFNNEINNNYRVVQVDKLLMNKIKTQNLLNSKISNSYNSNYYKNLNFINTLYQKVNNNGIALKNNNYFSNRDEMDDFIKKNKINFSKLNIKNEIIFRKDITKSEKPTERKNNFMNLDEKFNNKDTCNNSEKNKNNEMKRFSKNNSFNKIDNIIKDNNRNELINSYPTGSDFLKLKNDIKTPKNTSNKKDTISITENKINENINIDNILNQIKTEDESNKKRDLGGLKTIKLFDKKESNNDIKSNFEKANTKNGEFRYFNVFGSEGDDISLTQIEKDCSGIIDSSTSNEIQLNPDYFFKESPKNVFKGNKSDHSNSNFNEI